MPAGTAASAVSYRFLEFVGKYPTESRSKPSIWKEVPAKVDDDEDVVVISVGFLLLW